MKVIVCLLGFTCLFSTLTAELLDLPLEEEQPRYDAIEPLFGDNVDEMIATWRPTYFPTTSYPTTSYPTTTYPTTTYPTTSYPTTSYPTTSYPTTSYPTTSTTSSTSTTTRRPRPTTHRPRPTTHRPRPTTHRPRPTTHRPRPQPPRPFPPRPFPPRPLPPNVQIYNNANRSLGPMAAHLINILQNRNGKQDTIQSNDIKYRFRTYKPNDILDLEEEY